MGQNKFETCFPKFCITNAKGNTEHDCFQLLSPSSLVSFTVWMLTLDLVILEHHWQSLEKQSHRIMEIKNIKVLKGFVPAFPDIFLIYENLLFTVSWECDYNMCVSTFFSSVPLLVTTK